MTGWVIDMEEKYTQGIYIDGIKYNVPLLGINRNFDVLDKYAERNEDDGDLLREILGVYLNYDMSFGTINDAVMYQELIDILTEPKEFHDFRVPHTRGTFSFRGYISQTKDQYLKIHENTTDFHNLTCKFTMKKPYRTP